MSQVFCHTLLGAVAANTTSGVCTHQDNVSRRTVYVSGAFDADVKVEVSPDAEGETWFTALVESSYGVFACDVICRRLRARVVNHVAGAVTVKILFASDL